MLQHELNITRERMCAAEHAPRGLFRVLERRHGLAEILERGVCVCSKHLRVIHPHSEQYFIAAAENALRHGIYVAYHRLSFFKALEP